MTDQGPLLREHGNAYNIFILVLTIFSLAIMALLILPLDQDTLDLLTVYDNVICLIFLGDFFTNLAGAKHKRAYFIGARGWLDLLGSIPSLGIFRIAGLFRLARLSRLARITRLLGGKNRKQLVDDVIRNRGQYATFITILAAGMVLTVASVLVLQFESRDPDANIQTGGDALWWGIVTLTTVGYGDRFPVTLLGRITGISVMMAGVGIIGALASILASLLVPPPKEPESAADEPGALVPAAPVPAAPVPVASAIGPAAAPGVALATGEIVAAPAPDSIAGELARLREEIAALRASLPRAGTGDGG